MGFPPLSGGQGRGGGKELPPDCNRPKGGLGRDSATRKVGSYHRLERRHKAE